VPVLMGDVRGPYGDSDGEEREQRRDEIGAGVKRLRDEAEAVRGKAGGELERDERNRRTDRDQRRPPLRIHAASETEEPAEAGSSMTLR
jgi:hypothetical protein